MSEYATVELCEIEQLEDNTMICFDGVVTEVYPPSQNKSGTQNFVEISHGDCVVEILIFEKYSSDCKAALTKNNTVRVFGKVDGWTKNKKFRKILANSASPIQNKIEAAPSKKWNGLTRCELLFLRTQRLADSDFILTQVPVGKHIVDFVVYRRDDLSPVMAFEIDGDTHITNRINDSVRDSEIKAILGVDVKHFTNAQVEEDARKLGFI